jgi:hypothetical protein
LFNIAPGAGKSETSHNNRKRKQDASEESEPEDEVEEENDKSSRAQGQVGKQRRIETLGKKMMDREVYRKEQKRQKERGEQWSRSPSANFLSFRWLLRRMVMCFLRSTTFETLRFLCCLLSGIPHRNVQHSLSLHRILESFSPFGRRKP